MKLYSIRFKYTALFVAIALVMIFTAFMSYRLVSSLINTSDRFANQYNPAISVVINADRDLYQARVAELTALKPDQNINDAIAAYEENAQQAYDRMMAYLELMRDYPSIADQLSGFESAYREWRTMSNQSIDLSRSQNYAEAENLSFGESAKAFDAVREYYDIAGELVDQAGIAERETSIASANSQELAVLSLLTITIIIVLGVGVVAPRSLSKALLDLVKELKGLNSGDGNLTRRIKSSRKDEVGAVANQFDELIDGLAELIRGIINQSQQLVDVVGGMQKGTQEVNLSSEKQLISIEQIVTAVNEMTATIRDVAKNAQLTAAEIVEVNKMSSEGKEITNDTVNNIKEVANTVGNASAAISELEQSSTKIASVLDVIRGIAEQTNLLALNAAIEAARAGEQGRGFAVVADEVRSLASKTQQSTDDIQEMIETLQSSVTIAVNSVDDGMKAVDATVVKSNETLTSLNNIVEAAQRVTDAATQIATATEEQSLVAEEVNQQLDTLAELSKNSLDYSHKNNSHADTVLSTTHELADSLSRFRLE